MLEIMTKSLPVKSTALKRICIAIAITQAFTATGLQAASLLVDTNVDAAIDDTACSLREAIQSAIDGSADNGCVNGRDSDFGINDEITFSGLLNGGVITLTDSLPGLTGKTLAIRGPAPIPDPDQDTCYALKTKEIKPWCFVYNSLSRLIVQTVSQHYLRANRHYV